MIEDKISVNNQPLVSVLMTAFNREKYIAEAIESILTSTYKNFELIIVDDCSIDNTVEIIRQYQLKDSRVKLYINEANLGQFANRNLAASYAKGEYLKYVDSDDLIYSNGLEILVRMMNQFPDAGYGLCSIDQDKKYIYPILLSPEQAYLSHFFSEKQIFNKAPLSSIIKKDVFEKVNGFTNPGVEGDYDMWLKLSQQHSVVLMPHGIVWYRVHQEQIYNQREIDPYVGLRYPLTTIKYLKDPKCPLNSSQKKKVLKKENKIISRVMVKSVFLHPAKKTKQMYHATDYKIHTLLRDFVASFF